MDSKSISTSDILGNARAMPFFRIRNASTIGAGGTSNVLLSYSDIATVGEKANVAHLLYLAENFLFAMHSQFAEYVLNVSANSID